MRQFNITLEKVGEITKDVCKTAIQIVVPFALYTLAKNSTTDKIYAYREISYDDAISAIMKSSMFSGDKIKAATIIPKDGDAEMYKSVIHVMNTSMYSGDKIEAIKTICER